MEAPGEKAKSISGWKKTLDFGINSWGAGQNTNLAMGKPAAPASVKQFHPQN